MAAEIKKRFEMEPQLVKGSGGIFEVRFDDQKIFSNRDVGRFPVPGEVEETIARLLAS